MTENIIDNLYNLIKKLEKRVRKLEEEKSTSSMSSKSSPSLSSLINKDKQCLCLICGDNSHAIEECIISTNNVCFNCNRKGHLRKACHLQRSKSI
jgi:hypothetical protein